jgi:hypothetical protein
MHERQGWIITKDGSRHSVPEFLLDHEEITWPPVMREKGAAQQTHMLSASDFYRRHEIVSGEVYLFLRDSSTLADVPPNVIDELRGGE